LQDRRGGSLKTPAPSYLINGSLQVVTTWFF
jgi:hypothetical protein